MNLEFKVKYLCKGEILTARIAVSQLDKGEKLLEYIDSFEAWSNRDEFLFSSFCKLRNYLDEKGKILLCKGCRRNVHPSGSQLKWIYALMLTIGVRVDPIKDQVIIFDDELEIDQIVSVEEQQEFYREWVKSVTGNSIDHPIFGKRIISILSSFKNRFNRPKK